jgi:hypothetical protein
MEVPLQPTIPQAEGQNPVKAPLPTLQEKMSRPPGGLPPTIPAGTSMETLKDLMEKNLKWSQLIYEQNKKLQRHFLWTAVFTWIKVIITVAFIVIAVFFASSWYKDLQKKYPFVFGHSKQTATTSTPSTSFEEFLKVLPINDSQREQLKALIK